MSNPIEVLGYIEPGHGLRGRQNWLTSADDLKVMYPKHKRKQQIVLWCLGISSDIKQLSSIHHLNESDGGAHKVSRTTNYTKQCGQDF